MLSTIVIILIGYSAPMALPINRRLEYFNEATILACIYHYYIFTSFVPNPETRYLVGWSLIGFATLNVLVNLFFLLLATYETLKLNVKMCRQKCRIRKRKKSIKISKNMSKKWDEQ
jgi:hypothetical protein